MNEVCGKGYERKCLQYQISCCRLFFFEESEQHSQDHCSYKEMQILSLHLLEYLQSVGEEAKGGEQL